MKRKKKQSANSSPPPGISFIVSAYDDPVSLACCLWSLAGQTHRNIEVIVTDNAEDARISRAQAAVVKQVQSALPHMRYERTHGKLETQDCYHSAEWGARRARGTFLCFPCDDCYYVPQFAQRMLGTAYGKCLDFVECGVIGGPEMTGISVYLPMEWRTIKSNFIIKASAFNKLGFSGKTTRENPVPSAADQELGRQVRKQGYPWGKMTDVMVVHN